MTENLILIKLHENKQYLDECCDLLNSYWPRSKTARLHSLNKSNNDYPCNFILIDSKTLKLIGHVCVNLISKDYKTAFIESLIIDDKYRKKGFGRFLMNELDEILRKDQFKLIKLKTFDQVEFYKSIGYQLTHQTKSLAITPNISKYLFNQKPIDINKNLTDFKSNDSFNFITTPPPLPPPTNQNNYVLEYHLEKLIS